MTSQRCSNRRLRMVAPMCLRTRLFAPSREHPVAVHGVFGVVAAVAESDAAAPVGRSAMSMTSASPHQSRIPVAGEVGAQEASKNRLVEHVGLRDDRVGCGLDHDGTPRAPAGSDRATVEPEAGAGDRGELVGDPQAAEMRYTSSSRVHGPGLEILHRPIGPGIRLRIPYWASRVAAVTPTGPAPTITTG